MSAGDRSPVGRFGSFSTGSVLVGSVMSAAPSRIPLILARPSTSQGGDRVDHALAGQNVLCAPVCDLEHIFKPANRANVLIAVSTRLSSLNLVPVANGGPLLQSDQQRRG